MQVLLLRTCIRRINIAHLFANCCMYCIASVSLIKTARVYIDKLTKQFINIAAQISGIQMLNRIIVCATDE